MTNDSAKNKGVARFLFIRTMVNLELCTASELAAAYYELGVDINWASDGTGL
jgi:hypothetical protein